MSSAVLDASALLAPVCQGPGGQEVERAIEQGAAVSAVNLAKVASKLAEAGMRDGDFRDALDALDPEVHPSGPTLAYRVGSLRSQTQLIGLSLGDRACLALAIELGLPAITADRAWSGLSFGVPIRILR